MSIQSNDIKYTLTPRYYGNGIDLQWKGPLTEGISWIRGTNVNFGDNVVNFSFYHENHEYKYHPNIHHSFYKDT